MNKSLGYVYTLDDKRYIIYPLNNKCVIQIARINKGASTIYIGGRYGNKRKSRKI